MARKLRVQFEGAIYHVTIRGVERRRIFDDDSDRERFLARMADDVETSGVRLYLFALMRNHAHLLCETPRGNLSAFMQRLQTAYTVYYNLRHHRSGHLLQGRFGAEPVAGDEYLLKLSRYIHLNPVFVREIEALPLEDRLKYLREYRWSSFRGYAGLAEPWDFVDEGPILALTDAPAEKQRPAYRRFVEAGVAETDEEFVTLLKGFHWGIGDEAFQSQIRERYAEQALRARRKEDVAFRRAASAITPQKILDAVSREFGLEDAMLRRRQFDCPARGVAALLLERYAGMNQREIGALLGMGSGSATSRHLRRLRERLADDPGLRARVERLSGIFQTGGELSPKATLSIVKG